MIRPELVVKQRIIFFSLLVLIVITAIISMGIGYSSVSFDRILPILFGEGSFKEHFVLFEVRLPRILITILAGAALAVSGSILQGITRNDLADPGIIGINAGAGVVIAIFFLYFPIDTGNFVYLLPVLAFIGAFVTAVIIYLLSYKRNSGFHPIRLVLVGVGFAMALSGVMIVVISSAEREKVDFISKWIAGNIWGTDWPFIIALLPWLILLIPYAIYKANRLNILSMDMPVATGLGISIEKERFSLLITATALAAAAVAVTGGIAFIGLMAPHMAKALVGPRNQLFIPIATLLGGFLLLLADVIGQNLLPDEAIPAGVMTAIIGAPYFIYLLMKRI
ncbi:iron ABC transporter permease [Ornithinibacillus massiliensis]|uniref:Iron ABC transporter permease n=1 Tax=Ornithinibacillus massiliensis TaxID=1944633 RepID=A0ABS5MFE4_9BACI|nr:iron ABC transporter permease [Ornithinibacillus massiliensis]MBS3681055.1 iron ABC transporter permease [Ornithinibacillus massiliensis]